VVTDTSFEKESSDCETGLTPTAKREVQTGGNLRA